MSIKIYDGMKFKNAPTLSEARDIIFKFKEKVIEHYRKKYYELLAEGVVGIYDDAMMGRKVGYSFPDSFKKDVMHKIDSFSERKSSLVYRVHHAIERKSELFKEQSLRGHIYWRFDFDCNVSIIPSNDEVFVLIYTQDQEVKNMFSNMDEIEEYGYWDNVDPPDDLTAEQWDARGEEWEVALPGIGIPSKCGFSIDVVSEVFDIICLMRMHNDDPNPIDEVINYLPDYKDRVSRMSRIVLGEKWDRDHKEETNDLKWYQSLKKFEKWMEDNPEIVKKNEEKVSAILKEDLTLDDFKIICKDFCDKFGIKQKEKECKTCKGTGIIAGGNCDDHCPDCNKEEQEVFED